MPPPATATPSVAPRQHVARRSESSLSGTLRTRIRIVLLVAAAPVVIAVTAVILRSAARPDQLASSGPLVPVATGRLGPP